MSAESLLAYKVTDSTDSPGHEDVYIWGKPSFLLPYCLSIIKMSLLSVFLFITPIPCLPLASPWLPSYPEERALPSIGRMPHPCALPPLSLPSGITALLLCLEHLQAGSFSELSLGILSALSPPCHPCVSHCLPAFRALEMSPFP